MPTPTKPVSVLREEGKSHRTKAELELREQGEESLLTGMKLKEEACVRDDPVAHKEFLRMKKLLKSIEKSDDLYGATINRYCKLRSEELRLLEERDKLKERIDFISERLDKCEDDADFRDVSRSLANLEKVFVSVDRSIQSKRKMQAEIEKENVMTIASALRSIPKKPDKEEDPVAKILSG